ncbi:EexN family lipoprotein [Xanthomonas arboricola pv. corylina]|uniref:EexN family lipoprotein n=1 Tax=Xanthomonas arboricola TaxID=56448 RepID=UPI00404089A0
MKKIALIAFLTTLAGCSVEPERSYEYYSQHLDEANSKAKTCSEMSEAKTSIDGNCTRARKAIFVARPSKPQEWHSVAR